jgi:hypothetical protein
MNLSVEPGINRLRLSLLSIYPSMGLLYCVIHASLVPLLKSRSVSARTSKPEIITPIGKIATLLDWGINTFPPFSYPRSHGPMEARLELKER